MKHTIGKLRDMAEDIIGIDGWLAVFFAVIVGGILIGVLIGVYVCAESFRDSIGYGGCGGLTAVFLWVWIGGALGAGT
jgi:hypothetical protein